MAAFRHLILTVALIGLLVAASAANAATAVFHCAFDDLNAKPFADVEFSMYSWSKFSDTVTIKYLKDGRLFRESLTVVEPKELELFAFIINKEKPDKAMKLSVLDQVVDPNEAIERWPAVFFVISRRQNALPGNCYVLTGEEDEAVKKLLEERKRKSGN